MGLQVINLNKSFNGKKVVSNVSFKMDHPCALGLVGLNGAGKTTTIRMLIDIIKKDSGSVLWKNKELDIDKVKIGYLPEERGIYQKTKVKDQLLYFAKLKGMGQKEAEDTLLYWANKMGVSEYLNRKAETLSKGNQQKIQLLTVFMYNPDLIILDEPLSGLDPVNADLIEEILLDFIKQGKYIIITSHQMNVIEDFCEYLVMLKDGEIILQGNINDIKKEYLKNILCISGDKVLKEYLENKYERNENIHVLKFKNINRNEYELEIEIQNNDDKNKIIKDLINKKLEFNKCEIKTPSLREIFIEKAGEDNENK